MRVIFAAILWLLVRGPFVARRLLRIKRPLRRAKSSRTDRAGPGRGFCGINRAAHCGDQTGSGGPAMAAMVSIGCD